MKASVLEKAFEKAFKKNLEAAGFTFETQKKIDGALFRYDVYLERKIFFEKTLLSIFEKILIEIDGHGLGHSSVASLERDARKQNHAVLNGYKFFRLTTKHFKKKQKNKKITRIPGEYAEELVRMIIHGQKGGLSK